MRNEGAIQYIGADVGDNGPLALGGTGGGMDGPQPPLLTPVTPVSAHAWPATPLGLSSTSSSFPGMDTSEEDSMLAEAAMEYVLSSSRAGTSTIGTSIEDDF